MRNQPQSTFWRLVILIFSLILGISIFSDGMFFDGIAYASVARNLADGNGSFWHMTYTSTLHTVYYEQPPFTFFLQSLFFRLLGNGLYVERIYSYIMAILMMITIGQLWNEVAEKNRVNGWYPLLLWMSVPIVSWTYQNNMVEMTMGWLDALAVLFIIKGCRQNTFLPFLWAGVLTFLASFCKGLQGLFPIVVPLLYSMVFRQNRFSAVMIQCFLVMAIPVLIYTLFYFWPESHQFYSAYIRRRLEGTFQGLQNTSASHFYLLGKLITALVVPITLSGVMMFLSRLKLKGAFSREKNAFLFLLIGCSASLPLMVTLEQRPFYLTTAIPYYVLAIALWSQNITSALMEKIAPHPVRLKVINRILTAAIVLSVFSYPIVLRIPKRDGLLIHDVRLIGSAVPPGSVIGIPATMVSRWGYYAYFMRYDKISLDEKPTQPYFLSENNLNVQVDSCFHQVNLPLHKFTLYHYN